MENFVVFESEHFIVKQCSDVSIPGYLIIEPKIEVLYFSDLSGDVLQLLTILIAKVEKALLDVLDVETIYITKFAELKRGLHIHIFPRSEKLLQTYIQKNPSVRDRISGPLIFDWSRNYYKSRAEKLKEDITILETLSAVRQKIKST
jgi:diadenosine tetraphosphate (Ap4A) HIT family hydrolase